MLTLLGFCSISFFTVLVMTKRLSAVAALILVPVVFGIIGGFGPDLGDMMVSGIVETAPTAVMLVFALLYFLVMVECGLFEPFVRKIIAVVGDDPIKIVMGTAVLVMIVGLDGDGATAVLITVSSMYPIYRRIGLNPLIIAMLLGIISPILNWMPWGGPAARTAIALKIEVADIVVPMLPAFFISLASTLVFAYYLGRSEKRRLAEEAVRATSDETPEAASTAEAATIHEPRKVIEPRNFWFNLPLTVVLMVGLAVDVVPLPALVMAAFALAVTVNFPNLSQQRERLQPHSGTVVMLITLILAAGAFTGILDESGMVEAMSNNIISIVPESWGGFFAFVTAVLSMPLLIIMSTDSFFLGVVPVLGETAAAFSVPPEVIARASLIGMPCHSLSPLIAPIYFLATLLRTDIGSLQRFAWPWSFGLSFIALIGATLTGAIYAV
ncbi:CitMHS family transporter [Streptomyces sp. NPDC091272]|uniref:CitMHS family transporter n=1 Tax=Streptomyces sp. NPDC091272 TaxID=3365981 RepID=UPI0038107F5D